MARRKNFEQSKHRNSRPVLVCTVPHLHALLQTLRLDSRNERIPDFVLNFFRLFRRPAVLAHNALFAVQQHDVMVVQNLVGQIVEVIAELLHDRK
jgi:hypothetical protein